MQYIVFWVLHIKPVFIVCYTCDHVLVEGQYTCNMQEFVICWNDVLWTIMPKFVLLYRISQVSIYICICTYKINSLGKQCTLMTENKYKNFDNKISITAYFWWRHRMVPSVCASNMYLHHQIDIESITLPNSRFSE